MRLSNHGGQLEPFISRQNQILLVRHRQKGIRHLAWMPGYIAMSCGGIGHGGPLGPPRLRS